MAMKKIHLNLIYLILGYQTWNRGRTAEYATGLMHICSLFLGPNFQRCSKSLPLTLYNRSLCIYVDWSSPFRFSGGAFWGWFVGFFIVLALAYCKKII